MIGKLTGKFGGTTPDGAALIDVGGVGYVVRTPLFTLDELRKSSGAGVSVFVHTAVREDAIDLYGFGTEEELAFFKQLMSVKGLGPKTALGVLNVADVATLKRGIAAGDASTLTKVFGIGKKNAERMVVELRDKLILEASKQGLAVGIPGGDSDVVEALMALGYRADESRLALKDIDAALVGTHARLASALKNLGSRAKSY